MDNNSELQADKNGEVQTDLQSFFARLGKNYEYIAIGDTGHQDKKLQNFFESGTFLDGLKDGGVKIVAREVEQDRNRLVQDAYNQAPPEVFQDEDKRHKFIQEAETKTPMQSFMHADSAAIRKHGMQVAYVDMDWSDWATGALKKQGIKNERAERAGKMASNTVSQFSRFMRAIRSDSPLSNAWSLIWNDKEFGKAVWTAILSPVDSLTLLWHSDAIAQYRVRENNVAIADNVKAIKGEEPLAVILGATHISRARGFDENSDGKLDKAEEMDVDELLGESVVHVEIYSEENPNKSIISRAVSGVVNAAASYVGDINQMDVPHYRVYLDGNGGKGKIIKLPRAQEPKTKQEIQTTTKLKENEISMTDIGQLSSQTFPAAPALDQTKAAIA